jgi:hypothetical protein
MASLEEKEELKRLEREKMERMLDARREGRLPIRGCQPSCLPPLPPQIHNTMSPLQNRHLIIPPHELHPCATNAMVQPVPPPPQAANNMQILPTNLEPAVSNTVPDPVTPASFCQRMNCFRKNIVYPFGGKFTKNKRRRLHSSHKKVRAKKSKNNKHKRSSKRHKRYTHKH